MLTTTPDLEHFLPAEVSPTARSGCRFGPEGCPLAIFRVAPVVAAGGVMSNDLIEVDLTNGRRPRFSRRCSDKACRRRYAGQLAPTCLTSSPLGCAAGSAVSTPRLPHRPQAPALRLLPRRAGPRAHGSVAAERDDRIAGRHRVAAGERGHTTLVSYRDNTRDNIQIVQSVQGVHRRGRTRPHSTKRHASCRREPG
jgi:hypothetical protein